MAWNTYDSGLNDQLAISECVNADKLDAEARAELAALISVWANVQSQNAEKRAYYDSRVGVRDIGLNTIPETVNVPVSCSWAKKAVTAVSQRSRFDAFVNEAGYDDEELARIVRNNSLVTEYRRFIDSELIHGCMCATAGKWNDQTIARFHSAESSAMIWDTGNNRLRSGFVVADRSLNANNVYVPSKINLHMPGRIVEIMKVENKWVAVNHETLLDQPLMIAFRNAPTGDQPLGTSRISRNVRLIYDAVVRTMRDMQVSSAFNAAGQKYLLGLSVEQFMALKDNTRAAYIGAMMMTTVDENGNKPTFGQLPGVSISPFLEQIERFAKDFVSASGVSMSELGEFRDNQYYDNENPIVMVAEDLNAQNGESLRQLALLLMAVDAETTIDDLPDERKAVMAHFLNPARVSLSANVDSASKVGAVDAPIVGTPWWYQSMGYDNAEVAVIQSQRKQNMGTMALNSLFGGATVENNAPAETVGGGVAIEQQESVDAPITEEQSQVRLNGAQTQSLVSIIKEYSSGQLTEGQAASIISVALNIERQAATNLLKGSE